MNLGRHVLRLLLAEGDRHPLRDWLQFLGLTAKEAVAMRLGRAGYLAEASSRWRRRTRWVPADPDCAFAPMIRVNAVMAQTRPATVSDVVLAGMALASGLGSRVLPYGPADSRSNVESSIRKLHPGRHQPAASPSMVLSSSPESNGSDRSTLKAEQHAAPQAGQPVTAVTDGNLARQHLCRTGTHIAVARSASAPRQVQFAKDYPFCGGKINVLHPAALDDGNCDRFG